MTSVAAAHSRPDRVLVALCITEIVSWGTLYYSLPAAATFIRRDTGWTLIAITAAFSAGLILSAVAGIVVGRAIDRFGPRVVMTSGSVLGVIGLVLVSFSASLPVFVASWLVVGVAQAAVLYQPAFTVIGRHYGERRNRPLMIVTLVGGLASTVFVPLTTEIIHLVGWRTTYQLLALVLALITIPIHASLLPRRWTASALPDTPVVRERIVRTRRFILLQAGITLMAFGLYAVTINLIPLLTERGATESVAAIGLGLVGVGQLLGRLGVAFLMNRVSVRGRPLVVGLTGGIVLGVLAIVPAPIALLIVIAMIAGAVRGAMTLVQASAVADRWGTQRLGALNGAFGAPITAATAIAPVAGTVLASGFGGYSAAAGLLGVLVILGGILTARR